MVECPGTGEIVRPDAEVQLALTMYVVYNQSAVGVGRQRLAWRYEHPAAVPLIKQISHIMPIGLRLAVETMSSGEKAYILIDPLMAYGNVGLVCGDDKKSSSIPPDAALFYKVRLIGWQPSSIVTRLRCVMDGADRFRFDGMTEIDQQLDQAKKQIMSGKRQAALRSLGKMVKVLDRMRIDAEKEPKLARKRMKMLFEVLSLASECALEIGWYPLAAAHAKRTLEIIPHSANANFLLGRAYFALGYIDSAKRFVRTAWCNDPGNEIYERKLQEIRDHERLIYGSSDQDDFDEISIAEQLAEVIVEKAERPDVKRRILKDVERAIQKELNVSPNPSTFDIKGGFSQPLLDIIMQLFIERNRGYLVRLVDSKSLEIESLQKC